MALCRIGDKHFLTNDEPMHSQTLIACQYGYHFQAIINLKIIKIKIIIITIIIITITIIIIIMMIIIYSSNSKLEDDECFHQALTGTQQPRVRSSHLDKWFYLHPSGLLHWYWVIMHCHWNNHATRGITKPWVYFKKTDWLTVNYVTDWQ